MDIISVIRDVIDAVRDNNNIRLDVGRRQEVVISLAELNSLTEAEAAFHSHKVVLGRIPDKCDFRRLVDALRSGATDRRQMIETLQREPNGCRVRLIEDEPKRSLSAVSGEKPASERAINDADGLLTAAFRGILKSDSDPADPATDRAPASPCEILRSLPGSEDLCARRRPPAILGATPIEETVGLLVSVLEQMARRVMEQEYELCSLRYRLEGSFI
jgi:hypothetical protein